MALELTEIRRAIADNARTAAGLEDAKHYRPDNALGGTVFWVEAVDVEPSTLGRTRWTVNLEGTLLVQGGWDRAKQEKLDELLPLVWLGIETDQTLGGFAQSSIVMAASYLRDVEDGEPLGLRFDINVEA